MQPTLLRHPIPRICLIALSLVAILVGAGLKPPGALAQSGGDYTSPDDCASCHEEQYQAWVGSNHAGALSDPEFIEAWTRAGKPIYCYSCHTTGYDPVDSTYDYEGVGCLACHDFATESGVPHMTIDRSSERCGTCHNGTHAPAYDEWLVSDHATMNIVCDDCHQTHSTELRLEDPTELCTSCHQMDNPGDVHAQEGMACHDCHMYQGDQVVDNLSGRTNGAGHQFSIPAEACASCHGMTHALTEENISVDNQEESAAEQLEVCEEEQEEIALNTRNLGLMGGGLGGLLVGIALPYVLRRREEKNDS